MTQVGKNKVVTLSYNLTDPDGNMLDEGNEPIVYLHGGYDGVFIPIEDALDGKTIGETVTVKLQPNDAFGEYNFDLLLVEPVENLPQPLNVGMMIEGDTDEGLEEGAVFYTVTEIADGKAVLDGNHPLSGMALVFIGTIKAIRPATAGEITAREPLGS
ncbi:MAG: peptidylprolyl isomerase [Desulfuromonadaceae bacterium]|nr:peptidylprolyl isomerase [Desulfuromonadaceae bacterium]